MDTRHPVEGYFGSEFRVICNHGGVMAAWSQDLEISRAIFAFFSEKRPRTVRFLKFCSESFHHLTDRRCCVQILWNVADRKSCVIYRTKTKQKFGCLSNCCYCANRAQNLPGPAPNSVLTVLHTSSKSVHFRRSYSRTREDRFCLVAYFPYRLLEPITIVTCLYLRPLERYENGYKIWKITWFDGVRVIQGHLQIAPFDRARWSSY